MSGWRSLVDPHNPENRNAGNGGDLVKHTVSIAFLETLRRFEPWSRSLQLYEVHAGRGVYLVPPHDPRRPAIDRVLASDLPLAVHARDVIARTGADPEASYPGSSALHASLALTHHEAYEWAPATRRILRAVMAEGGFGTHVVDEAEEERFDGESYLARRLPSLPDDAVLALDPFGIWRHPRHAERRRRYRVLFEARARHARPPPLSCFLTWGHDARGEAADLDHDAGAEVLASWRFHPPRSDQEVASRCVDDGYGTLARLVPDVRICVRWHWDIRCAMWLLVPAPLAAPVGDAVVSALERLVATVEPKEAGFAVTRCLPQRGDGSSFGG